MFYNIGIFMFVIYIKKKSINTKKFKIKLIVILKNFLLILLIKI